jgi:hypothetical protein
VASTIETEMLHFGGAVGNRSVESAPATPRAYPVMFKANAAMKPVTKLDLKKATEMTSIAVLRQSACGAEPRRLLDPGWMQDVAKGSGCVWVVQELVHKRKALSTRPRKKPTVTPARKRENFFCFTSTLLTLREPAGRPRPMSGKRTNQKPGLSCLRAGPRSRSRS